jgi:hypothetical protein
MAKEVTVLKCNIQNMFNVVLYGTWKPRYHITHDQNLNLRCNENPKPEEYK